jgi:non-homologous end joining protein Ku
MFYFADENYYVGIDNTEKEIEIKEFSDLQSVKKWFINKDTYIFKDE